MHDTKLITAPLFSIVTVTFNAAKTIERTMTSVAEQTATDYEHIIMDGVSRDSTLTIAERRASPRTRIFSSPDHGIYDAMNKALGLVNGQYVIFLNSGDSFYDANTLARYVEAASSDSNPGMIYGQTVLVDKDNNIIGQRHLRAPEHLSLASFANGMTVCHQAMAVRRDIAPIYDTAFKFSADYEWAVRILQHSECNVYLGDTPVIRYLAEGVTTRNHGASLKERFRIMCHYYGTMPTVARHAKFLMRYGVRCVRGSANRQ